MRSNYWKFGLVLSINAVVMFLITYVIIDGLQHFHANINRAYMAILMVSPMALLMLWTMRSMYQDRKLNWILAGIFVAIMIGVFMLIRTQTPVDDEQFLHSMIPHHSGAILMCERSAITDQEIRRLCETIVKTQKDEIAQMEAILTRLN